MHLLDWVKRLGRPGGQEGGSETSCQSPNSSSIEQKFAEHLLWTQHGLGRI